MKKFRRSFICIALLIIFIIFIAGNIWASSNCLTVNDYEFATQKTENDIKLVVLSDLHNHEFGENNSRLVDKVKAQQPDLILLDGDFVNEDSKNAKITCELVRALRGLAPVYFSIGNHESVYVERNGTDLFRELEAAGATVLDEDYVDLEINGTKLRLGGMYDYAFGLNGNNNASAIPKKTGDFLREFQDTEGLKIMMAHRPDSFIFGDAAEYWDVDLVVSGHHHGGQIVVPFLGGLYASDQGKFPEYVHGMYEKGRMEIFITSGLGSYTQTLPRFNNLPEIAVVKITEKQ